MNEVEELTKLDSERLPALKSILFDDLHHKVLNNLYLEMGTGPVLYLLSPSYSVVNPSPNETVSDFLTNKENLLDYIKEYIMQNLAVYSVLLDVNSYFVEANNYLVLARLRERDSGGRRYEIKFYTHSALELMTHYADKIYIGCFLNAQAVCDRIKNDNPDVVSLVAVGMGLAPPFDQKTLEDELCAQYLKGLLEEQKPDNPAYINLKTQILSTDMEIESLIEDRQHTEEEIANYQRIIENSILIEKEYNNLQRDYNNAKDQYNVINKKFYLLAKL